MSATVAEAVAKINKVGTARPLQEAQKFGCYCQHLGSTLPQVWIVVLLVFVCENLCRAKEVFPLGYPNGPPGEQIEANLGWKRGQGFLSWESVSDRVLGASARN